MTRRTSHAENDWEAAALGQALQHQEQEPGRGGDGPRIRVAGVGDDHSLRCRSAGLGASCGDEGVDGPRQNGRAARIEQARHGGLADL